MFKGSESEQVKPPSTASNVTISLLRLEELSFKSKKTDSTSRQNSMAKVINFEKRWYAIKKKYSNFIIAITIMHQHI